MTVEEFRNIDSTFNESMFITKVNNIFVKLFTAIMLDKLDTVDHFINDEVYDAANNILNNVKSNGWRQMYDELNVKESKITNIEVNNDVYIINVYLQSRYMDYIINLGNGSLVSGNNSSRIQVDYNLTFTKKSNAMKQGIIRKCPGCGAPVNVNTSGICDYCGTSYNQEDYDWVLVKLEKIN